MRGCRQSGEFGSPSASISLWTSCSQAVPALGSPPNRRGAGYLGDGGDDVDGDGPLLVGGAGYLGDGGKGRLLCCDHDGGGGGGCVEGAYDVGGGGWWFW